MKKNIKLWVSVKIVEIDLSISLYKAEWNSNIKFAKCI